MHRSEQKAVVIFNKLMVNEIEDSSGIFIGTNQAIAWSSYSKTNQGFGTLKDAVLRNSVTAVHDSDVIDAPVHDARYIAGTAASNNLQQCAIHFGSVQVNTVMNNSAIDLGDNKQLGWRSARKVNYGGSKNLGSNRMSQVFSVNLDNDVVDAAFRSEGQIVESASAPIQGNIRITQQRKQDPSGDPDVS